MDPGNPLEYGEWGAHTWAGPVAPAVHRGYYLPEEEEDAAALAAADYGGFDRRRHGWGPDGQEGQERRRRRRLAPVTRCKLHLDSDEVEAWAAFVHADVLVLSKASDFGEFVAEAQAVFVSKRTTASKDPFVQVKSSCCVPAMPKCWRI